MDDVLVVEAADHMDDGIGHTDVGQELVAQSLALGGALYQAGDVHKLNDCGGGLVGVGFFGEHFSGRRPRGPPAPPIGPLVGGGGGGVGRGGGGARFDWGGFAPVGQTHDT